MEEAVSRPRRKLGKKILLTCDCRCGETFLRYRNKISPGRSYLNREHAGVAGRARYLQEMCGPYLELVTEYLNDGAVQHYSRVSNVRTSLCPFFRYLCTHDITSISAVTSETITDFKVWAHENGYPAAGSDTSALSTFFKWLIFEERYEDDSPVVGRIHAKVPKPRAGRPYSDSEVAQMRVWLRERGNPRLRAFFEIASESGMRISEISRLRIEDVEFNMRTLQVRLPNKTKRERVAFFSDRASVALVEWINVRDGNCGHDFLFHNNLGGPLSSASIRQEFQRVFCNTYKGRVVNEVGLKSFSIHRLRHTLSSNLSSNGADANTQMAVLGWASPDSVDGYTKISEDAKVRGFAIAAKKVEEQRSDGTGKKILTMEEFLKIEDDEAA